MFQFRFASLVSSVVLVLSFGSILALSSAPCAQIQPPEVEWERVLSAACGNEEKTYSVQQTSGGEYIVTGRTCVFHSCGGSHACTAYLVKTDAQGNVAPEFPKTFGGALGDIHSIQQTQGGGYIMVGAVWVGTTDVSLIKTDAEGNLAPGWPKTFGGAGVDVGSSVQQTDDDGDGQRDDGYIVAGYTTSFGAGGSDIYLLKIDAAGNLEWQQTFGKASDERAWSVQQTSDREYIVAGETLSFGAGDSDAYLVNTDAEGNLRWENAYGGPDGDRAYSVQQTDDGGYIMAGQTGLFNTGLNIYLVKTDAEGAVDNGAGWIKILRGFVAYSVQQTTDGGYLVGGEIGSDIYLFKTDALGTLLWQDTFGGADWDGGALALQTADGGYLVAGNTVSFGAVDSDVYLIKLKPEIPPVPPLPPADLVATYSDARAIVTLAWQPSPSTVDRYLIERKLGCGAWLILDGNVSSSDPTIYEDGGVSSGTSVCYRVSAANTTLVSTPTEPACLAVPATSRYQLKLYDPQAPNPNSNEPGAWVDCYPCDYRFQPDRGTAVIVHGFQLVRDQDQLGQWMLDTAKAISKRLRNPANVEQVNILAWEWLTEAYGEPRQVQNHINPQASHLAEALEPFFGIGYEGPAHLMGHSMGTHVVTVCAAHLLGLTGEHPLPLTTVNPQQIQLTLWDVPDLADVVVGSTSYLDYNVYVLRGHGVYVDAYDGIFEFGTHLSNLWVNVPYGVPFFGCNTVPIGHAVDNWYRCTIPENKDPPLYQTFCSDQVFPGTIGFGTSVLLGEAKSRPESPPGPCRDVGTLMFVPVFCLFTLSRPFVFLGAENCQVFVPTQVTTSDLTTGDYWFREDWQPNFGTVNSTEMFFGAQAKGEGGGGGGQDQGEPDVRYSLTLEIQQEWDYLSFEYDFTEAAAPTTLSVTIAVGETAYPIFEMTSDLVLAEGYLDTGLRDIRQLHGQSVTIAFALRSAQPGMTVYLRNLTFWRDPWNGNHPPVANAGADQEPIADVSGTAIVTLDGSATTDEDGDPLTYQWMVAGELIATGIQPTVELLPGAYDILLMVRDPADTVNTDAVHITVHPTPSPFIRGDSNVDGEIDVSDVVRTLLGLFAGAQLACQDAADANDDGTLNLTDPIFTLGFLFTGQPSALPAPYPGRGPDPSLDQLGCDFYPL